MNLVVSPVTSCYPVSSSCDTQRLEPGGAEATTTSSGNSTSCSAIPPASVGPAVCPRPDPPSALSALIPTQRGGGVRREPMVGKRVRILTFGITHGGGGWVVAPSSTPLRNIFFLAILAEQDRPIPGLLTSAHCHCAGSPPPNRETCKRPRDTPTGPFAKIKALPRDVWPHLPGSQPTAIFSPKPSFLHRSLELRRVRWEEGLPPS